MNNDRIKTFLLELLLLIFLVFALFVSNIYKILYLSIFMFFYGIIISIIIKKNNVIPYYRKEIIRLMLVFGIIYVMFFYLLGFYFGFYKSSILFGWNTLKKIIIPLCILIYSTEFIREKFLSYKSKVSKFMILIITILIDLILYNGVYSAFNLVNLDDFLSLIGFAFFASMSNNLLYNYISIRYGKNGIIIYKFITSLYMYIIPVVPNVYMFFRIFLRIIYPYFIYLFLKNTYSKSSIFISSKCKTKEIAFNVLLVTISLFFIMLVSCKFKYGILVIGSGSMTGTINIGDAIIMEKYNKQRINEGDIIVFEKDGLQIVHRVIDVKNINNEYRFYTKGDANNDIDDKYRTIDDIRGVLKLKIKYIGYPTVWVKKLFS